MKGNSDRLILYYYTKPTTFVKRDIAMLRTVYEVKEFSFYHSSKLYTPILFLKQLYFLLCNTSKANIAFCMFAGYHSFLPAIFSKIFNKRFVIILGGTECVSIPAIGYGVVNKGLIGKFAGWSYHFTKEYAPVHQSLIYSNNEYDKNSTPQGITHYFPHLKAHFSVIPNGFDPEKFKCGNDSKLPNSFVTVAFDLHRNHLFQLKGIDLITALAPHFPSCTFTIIGLSSLKKKPDNVKILPPLPQEQLINELCKHEFYFQLSLSEGFPNALCEAMLCNCIPVVSNVASMPEIIAKTGFILEKREIDLLIKLMRDSVLPCNRKELASKARERIIYHYHLEQRKAKFIDLINSLQ